MITKLHFENLRCFKDFTIEDMTPLTLISGRNNVGKSTLLEGIFLVFSHISPDLFIKINAIRGVPLFSFSPQFLWEPLFYDANISQELSVCCELDGITHSIVFKKDEQFIPSIPAPIMVSLQDIQSVPGSYPLKIVYLHGSDEATGHYIFQGNGLGFLWDSRPPKQRQNVQYISPKTMTHTNDVAKLFGKAELDGKKEVLIDAVRLLDADIEDISTIFSNSAYLYARRKNGPLLPLSSMGDGINKLLMILCSILIQPEGIVLIDEIENGFHYSFYPKLWELLAQMAKETKNQIFATTHSYECIESAMEGVSAVDKSLLSYVRLGKQDHVILPYQFSSDNLAFAIEKDMEVR